MENDRGIFTVTALNSILQKLLYNDNYENIDSCLSDSNVGACKNKNIRNHSFIINGIIHDTIASKSKSVDFAILDYRQCFDALAVDICTNDLYILGVTNDHLNLFYECDSQSNIAVKTPLGLTDRVNVQKIVKQGEIVSSLKCTVTVDSIAEKHEENLNKHLFLYKEIVPVPPLTMVDDTVGIANCGLDSALSTCHLNTQTNIKKLQFGQNKCHKLHIGQSSHLCTNDTIDTWKLQKEKDFVSSILDMVDIEGEKHVLEILSSDCYLGDIIQNNGKNDLNIKDRHDRGSGAVKQICQMLDDLCLGEYHYEVANILRSSLLLSTLLSNSESWYSLTKGDIIKLESVEEDLMRKVFKAHSKTPKVLLYLETGNIPIRFILQSRRINFLWYILNENDDTLLKKFFNAQNENPVRGDWVSQVKNDLAELGIEQNFDDIRHISKHSFKRLVKDKVRLNALNIYAKKKILSPKAEIFFTVN